MTTPKFKITTNGDLIINTYNYDDNTNSTNNYSMESLVTFQQQRIEALEEHIQMLENECNALYSQINECDCRLTVTD